MRVSSKMRCLTSSEVVDNSLVVAEAGTVQRRELRATGCSSPSPSTRSNAWRTAGKTTTSATGTPLRWQNVPGLREPRQIMWLKRLETKRDNVRGAMRWLLGNGESETVARIGWAL